MRNNILKMPYIFVWLVLSFSLMSSCKNSNSLAEDKSSETKVQAVIKTLDTTFDPSIKDSITGNYISLNKLEVPRNLVPQNKWFMFEGPVLENDVIAYRFYADKRHRFDIYGKSVSDLVMDTVSWNYHDIMNWGSDILKVANTFGIGSPAVYWNDSIIYLTEWDSKKLELIHEDADSVLLRTTFHNLKIVDESIDLVQDWSMISGSPWSTIDLSITKGKLPETATFATGFINHIDDLNTVISDDKKIYFNFGQQSYHEQNLGMAIAVNNNYKVRQESDASNHTLICENCNESFNYKFMAGWENGIKPLKSEEAFRNYLSNY